MLHNPKFALDDVQAVKGLITQYPWATIVAEPQVDGQIAASHYPVILDDSADDDSADDQLVLLTHVGRPDDEILNLASGRELLVIIQGPQGYVSASWYPAGQFVPTWNHISVHMWGVPEILDVDENYEALARMVDFFERDKVEAPVNLRNYEVSARDIAQGTVGFRLRVTRIEGLAKLSQNKPASLRETVIDHLEQPGPYMNTALAQAMQQTLDA